MARVILDNVVKRYGKTEVVHGVDLTIADIEFLVLVGPSGCGKSTLLRMVAGLEEISEGRILIDGKVVNDVAPKDRGCAMVFQNYALYPHMNVYKNMSFGLTIKGFSKTEIESRVQEAAKILGIGELLARKPHELSGGQRQRVAMGRAIVRNPSVFLFDEPLSNLDAKLRNSMRTEIKRLHQKVRSTIIYVTHDQVEAMTLADRIVVMRSGRVEQIGTPIELFEHPANTFVAGFIGSPPMNLIDGRLLRNGDGCQAVLSEDLRIPIPDKERMGETADGQKIVFGIRTESIRPIFPGFRPTQADEWNTSGLVEVVEPLGGETHLRTDIQGVKFTAKAVILATGRFLSGGLEAHPQGIREHLLDLPVTQPADRSHWYRESYTDRRGHAIHRAGIEVDGLFRPLQKNGKAHSDRLFAAGIILAHQDWIRSRSGAGIAIATAYQAVRAAEQFLISQG